MTMRQELLKEISGKNKQVVSILRELIEANTVNPPGNEFRAAKVVEKYFKKYKIKYKKFEKAKGRTNIIGYIGKGKPRLFIGSHLDVVPAGDGWKTNPFKAVIKNGKIYGRGAEDNKGSMAASIIAGIALKKFEKELKGQILIGGVADEERGSQFGAEYLLKSKQLKTDYAIIPDIGNHMKKISIGEKGLLHLRIKSIGRQAHGSTPELGVNAIYPMIEFLSLIKKYKIKAGKKGIFSKPTINVGMIKAGHAPNIVPGECEAEIDFRYLPTQKNSEIVKDVKKMLNKVKKKNKKIKFKLEVFNSLKPIEIHAQSKLIKVIQTNTEKIIKIKPKTFGTSGTTISKNLVWRNINSVGFAPGSGEVAHVANEYIEIKELLQFAKILSLTAVDLLT